MRLDAPLESQILVMRQSAHFFPRSLMHNLAKINRTSGRSIDFLSRNPAIDIPYVPGSQIVEVAFRNFSADQNEELQRHNRTRLQGHA